MSECICSTLTFATNDDLLRASEKSHHHKCPAFKTEKQPRLFYIEEGVSGWVAAPSALGAIIGVENMDDGETQEISFKCIEMTDEEFENLPED